MTQTILITPERVVLNDGQFDTDFRYLRETSGDHVTTLLAGPSLGIRVEGWPSDSFAYVLSWRFKVGALNVAGVSSSAPLGAPADVVNISTNIAL